jgi:hypothetical protein
MTSPKIILLFIIFDAPGLFPGLLMIDECVFVANVIIEHLHAGLCHDLLSAFPTKTQFKTGEVPTGDHVVRENLNSFDRHQLRCN